MDHVLEGSEEEKKKESIEGCKCGVVSHPVLLVGFF